MGISMLCWLAGVMLAVLLGIWCCLRCCQPLIEWLESELLAILRRCLRAAMDEATSKLAWRAAADVSISGVSALLAPLLQNQLSAVMPSSLASLSNLAG